MPVSQQDRDDEFDASEIGPAALLRLEIRYLRRDIEQLSATVKSSIQSLHEGKASKDTADDHESRLRLLEGKASADDHEARLRLLEGKASWAAGFGAAFGAIAGTITGVLVKVFWH